MINITIYVILRIMNGFKVKEARRAAGWTQERLAKALGCSQPYLSLMENGRRTVPEALRRKMVRVLGLPLTYLPVRSKQPGGSSSGDWARRRLGELSYPGYRYLGKRRRPSVNPTEVLLRVLTCDRCDPRLMAAMPWLLLHFSGFDREALVEQARRSNVQNRLGFVTALARETAKSAPRYNKRLDELNLLDEALEFFRLARQDDLGQNFKTRRFRDYVHENRSGAATHWNILTTLAPHHLNYDG